VRRIDSLRFIVLVHDTFKHRVNRSQPRTGENYHAMIARRFAEDYTDNKSVLDLIELHDEAYNCWVKGTRSGRWGSAEARAHRLLSRLGSELPLYLHFFRAHTETGDKDTRPLDWFEQFAAGTLPS
jgi:hypothetical protein